MSCRSGGRPRGRRVRTHVLELLLAVLVVLVVVLHGPCIVLPVAKHLGDLLPRLLRQALDPPHPSKPLPAALLALGALAPLVVLAPLPPRLGVLVRVARLGPRLVRVVLDEAGHLVRVKQALDPAVVPARAVVVVGKDVLQVGVAAPAAARGRPVVRTARGGARAAQAAELVLLRRGDAGSA